MNWQAIEALAALFGAAAVVVTLLYLATQVRYAKRQIEINGFYSRGQTSVAILMPLLRDPEICALLLKAGHPKFGDFGFDDPIEAQRLGAFCHIWMQVEQANHYLLPEGTHDEFLRFFLSIPAYAEFWDKNKNGYDKEFVARMDRIRQATLDGIDPDDLYARLD
jgi:hypothetical protein